MTNEELDALVERLLHGVGVLNLERAGILDWSMLQDAADAIESLSQQLATVTAERDELVEALSKYGHHINGCGQGWNCTCGFYAALAKLGDDKTGEK